MKLVKVEDVSSVAKKLFVTVETKEVTKALEKAYKKIGRQAKIKGFRSGKVPRSILERYYGPQAHQEVISELVGDSYKQAIEKSGLEPAVRPTVDPGPLTPDKPYRYEILVEIAPEIEVEGYTDLNLTRQEREITDEIVATKLDELRQMHAKLEAAPEDKAAEAGDYVVADIKAEENGQPVAGGEISDFDIQLGGGRFNPEVEKALEGAKKGETREMKAAFAKDFFHDAMAGKEVDLTVTVKEVRKAVLPELDAEFAKSVGSGYESLDALKGDIRQELEKSAERDAENKVREQLLDQILEKTTFDVPDGMVDLETQRMIAQVEQSLGQRGLNFQAAGISPEKLEQDIRPQALRRVQEGLILKTISVKEGLEVDDKDLEEAFQELAEQVGQESDEVRRFHEDRGLIEPLKEDLVRRKTLNYLLSKANIKKEPLKEEPKAEEEAAG